MRSHTQRIILGLLIAALIATPTKSKEQGKMDPYSNASAFNYYLELTDPPEAPEATTPRMFAHYFNGVTNRFVILGDDDGKREIPTFATEQYGLTPAASVVLMNEAGDFDTVIFPENLDPLIDMGDDIPGFNAAGVRWPEGDGQLGEFAQVQELTPESPRDTGEPDQNRHVLGWQKAPHVMAEDVEIDLDSASNQVLLAGVDGYRIVITELIFHTPSGGSVTTADGAVKWEGGNTITSPILSNLDHADANYFPLRSESFWSRGPDGEDLIYDPNTLEGTARTCKVDVVGYYKPAT